MVTRTKRLAIRSAVGEKIAVIYLRMSSDPQKDSIEQQREDCLLYASDHGYTVLGEYVDKAFSGVSSVKGKKQRKGFNDLVRDATAGKFEFVICWAQNRASRSKPREFFEEMNPIADANVKIVLTDKGVIDLNTFEGFIQAACGANSDNEFIKDLSRRVVRGQRAKAKLGLLVAGSAPFALRSVEAIDENGNPVFTKKGKPLMGRIVVGDPDDVKTVKLMFAWYLEGLSIRGIVEKLKTDRAQTRSARFVQKVLASPFYVGDYQWNAESSARFAALRDGRITDDFVTGKTSSDDRVYIADNHEPIIDRETFNRVQALRAERKLKKNPFRNGGEHLLTGLCRCAKCGKKFSGHRYTDRVTISCNGYREGVCKGNYVDQEQVVGCIITSLEEFLTEERIAKLRRKLTAKTKRDRKTVDVPALTRKLIKKQAEYDQCRTAFRQSPQECKDDFAADLRKVKAEIEELMRQIKKSAEPVESEVVRFDLQVERLVALVGNLKEVVATVGKVKPHMIREMIASIVDSVVLNVGDRGPKKNPRFYLDDGGEIALKSAFNLLPVS